MLEKKKKRLRPCLLEVAESRVNDVQKAENYSVRENVPQTEAPLKTLLKSVREANASSGNTGNLVALLANW